LLAEISRSARPIAISFGSKTIGRYGITATHWFIRIRQQRSSAAQQFSPLTAKRLWIIFNGDPAYSPFC
jgi:hypothetical protein